MDTDYKPSFNKYFNPPKALCIRPFAKASYVETPVNSNTERYSADDHQCHYNINNC